MTGVLLKAGSHAYASRDGHYQGLSSWRLDLETEELVGEMTLPMPVATKGGSIGLNPRVAPSVMNYWGIFLPKN